jgi:hypothetical protein
MAAEHNVYVTYFAFLTFLAQDPQFVQDELQCCREILELENDQCKWALLTMVISQMGSILNADQATELLSAMDKLIKLDPMRTGYYRDVKSDVYVRHVAKRDGNKLDLSNAKLTRFSALSGPEYQDLEELNLSQNEILYIPPINLPNLRVLILDNNHIEFLDNLDKYTKLEQLSLRGNKVADVIGEVVANSNITEIDLRDNPFKATVENLRSSFPNLQTVHSE